MRRRHFTLASLLVMIGIIAVVFAGLRYLGYFAGPSGHLVATDASTGRKVYYFEAQDGQKPRILVVPADDSVRPLEYAPESRERFLNHGDWLVMAVALWSTYDLKNIAESVAASETLKSQVTIGIRPYYDISELTTWCEIERGWTSPVWIVIRDGKVCASKSGAMAREEIIDFVQKAGVRP